MLMRTILGQVQVCRAVLSMLFLIQANFLWASPILSATYFWSHKSHFLQQNVLMLLERVLLSHIDSIERWRNLTFFLLWPHPQNLRFSMSHARSQMYHTDSRTSPFHNLAQWFCSPSKNLWRTRECKCKADVTVTSSFFVLTIKTAQAKKLLDECLSLTLSTFA